MEPTNVVRLAVGVGYCVGGKHPEPPIDAYPLLVWCPDHERYGTAVLLEDQSASIEEIAAAVLKMPNIEMIAKQFNTTVAHVSQAISYAVGVGLLKTSGS